VTDPDVRGKDSADPAYETIGEKQRLCEYSRLNGIP